MLNKFPKKIVLLSFFAASASAGANSTPLAVEDVVKFYDQGDGKVTAVCSYGGVEKDITLADLENNNVCKNSSIVDRVKFLGVELGGGACRMQRIRVPLKLKDTTLAFSSFRATKKDIAVLCYNNFSFAVPEGYRVAVKSVEFRAYISESLESDVYFSISGEGDSGVEKKGASTSAKGYVKQSIELERPIYSPCSDSFQKPTKIRYFGFASLLQPGEVKGDERAHVEKINIPSFILEKCS